MKAAPAPTPVPTGFTPRRHFVIRSKRALFLSLLVAGTASVGSAAIITPQTGGSSAAIDPVGGEEMDAEATGSVTLATFNSSLSGRVTQANWTGVSGQTGNSIDGDDVDVRIDHSPTDFAATATPATAYNSSSAGTGYRWAGTDGQQLTVRFGTQGGSFNGNRTVKAAGLMLLNFGGAYSDVTITYFDPDDAVLSTQNFSGGADAQGTGNGADFFTGYISSSQNIARLTIYITRNAGSSDIALDALSYVVDPELEATDPADNAFDVPLTDSLTATFTKPVVAVAGTIELRLSSDDSLVEAFDVASSARLTFVDEQLTIDPTSDLLISSAYYVLMTPGVVEDAAGNGFAGITDPATWSFSTPIPESATLDFDPSSEFAAEFSGGGYSEDAAGGLAGSVGITLAPGSPTGFDGSQAPWLPADTFVDGATMTVGAFFNLGALPGAAGDEVLRLGLNNGGADNFAQLPFASISWDGTGAQLEARDLELDTTTFPLSTGQWYYFEASFTRVGTDDTVDYALAVANADSAGNIGAVIRRFSVSTGTNVIATELNRRQYGGFRGESAPGVLDNFYVSRVGASQLPAGDTYAEWIGGFSGVGDEIGFDQDPDGDGDPNGVENFFGTPPDAISQGITPGVVGGGTFTFTHPQGSLASDLIAAYQWSKDLMTFNADGATDGDGTKVDFTVQLDTPIAGTTTVTATVTGSATKTLFVRFEVDGIVVAQD